MSLTANDTDILAALGHAGNNGKLTAYVASIVSSRYVKMSTALVLRRLKKLENDKKVRRVPSSYRTQLCWMAMP